MEVGKGVLHQTMSTDQVAQAPQGSGQERLSGCSQQVAGHRTGATVGARGLEHVTQEACW